MTLPRPHIPASVKLAAALIQLGLDPETAELDHDPALVLRRRTPDGGYDPPANDPRSLKWRSPEAHKTKTFGNGATTRGSDIGEAAKTKRLEKKRAAKKIMDGLNEALAVARGESEPARLWKPKPKRNWPSRPFPKSRKFKRRSKAK